MGLLLLVAALAVAADPVPSADDTALRIEGIRERIRTSLQVLEKKLSGLDGLTASYAGDAAAADGPARGELRREVEAERQRLNESFLEFWPIWDAQRMAQGVRLMGSIIKGVENPQAGSAFLEPTEIDDFKAEVYRTQERIRSALDREEAAHTAFLRRVRAQRQKRLLAAAAGAGAAALAAGGLWASGRRPAAPSRPS